MQQYQIEPLKGVGPVRLGASRAEVHAVLGSPAAAPVRAGEMFFDGFFVHYDSSDRVEFIELAPSTQFVALFHGVALHQLPAGEAVAFVSRHASYDADDP